MKVLKFWLPPIIWGLVIFSFSSLKVGSTSQIVWTDFIIKKTAHIIEYGILSILLYRAMINYEVDKKKAIWISIVLAFLYGITDEFHQSFTPGRQPHLRDVIIDTIGAGVFLFVIVENIYKLPKSIQKIAKKLDI